MHITGGDYCYCLWDLSSLCLTQRQDRGWFLKRREEREREKKKEYEDRCLLLPPLSTMPEQAVFERERASQCLLACVRASLVQIKVYAARSSRRLFVIFHATLSLPACLILRTDYPVE